MNRIEALIDDSERLLKKLEDKTVASVAASLDAAFNRLEARLRAIYADTNADINTPAGLRLKMMVEQLGELLRLVRPQDYQSYLQRYQQLCEEAYKQGLILNEEMVKAYDPDTAIVSVGVNVEAVAFSAQNAAERLRNHSEVFRQQAIAVIGYNLAIGSSAAKTAQELQKGLGIVKSRAEMIARTETMSALNEAADYFYEENDVEYVQVFATADDKLCRFCGARNQSIYKRGEIKVPLHVRCRCYLTPVKPNWLDKGLIDKSFAEQFFDQTRKEVPQLDYGLAPFEKAQGSAQPPKPVWKPGEDFPELSSPPPKRSPKKPKPKPEPKPEPPKPQRFKIVGDPKEVMAAGQRFYEENYKEPDNSIVNKLQANVDRVKKKLDVEIKKALKEGRYELPEGMIDEFNKAEKELEEARRKIVAKESVAVAEFRSKLLEYHGISLEEAIKKVTANVTFDDTIPEINRDTLISNYAEFYRLTGGKAFKSLQRLKFDDPRAYASRSERAINVGSFKKETQFHEAGHHIEYESEAILEAANRWRNNKAESYIPVKLNELTSINYDDDEKALKDNYYDPYVGKIYGSPGGDYAPTEVVSMGIEAFTTPRRMLNLREYARDHFFFTLGVIIGEVER